jgi:hypothetical protein
MITSRETHRGSRNLRGDGALRAVSTEHSIGPSARRGPVTKDGFVQTTASYEAWRERRIPIVPEDLAFKHAKMTSSPFVLFRGSYYRFFQQFDRLLPELTRAPTVLAVGDLHVENFGTWRDRDSRLAWGVNDLDEIDLLPYTLDLVRLASSAVLAIAAGHLELDPDRACEAIHAGWRERIADRRPLPFVLGDQHVRLYRVAREAMTDPVVFEKRIKALPAFERALPKPAARMLAQVLPTREYRPALSRRVAGVGSLGSRRIVAHAEVDGGIMVREAKQVPGPASMWAQPKRRQIAGLPGAVDAGRRVAADPYRRQSRKWVLRPLAPDATRLELASLRRKHSEIDLLHSMGSEAANIHLISVSGAAPAKAVRRDDAARDAAWLRAAVTTMSRLVEDDFKAWCNDA